MEEFEEINNNYKKIRLLHFGGSGVQPIKLIVHRQGGGEGDICYIFDRKLPLRILLEDYCKTENLAYSAMRFLYNGTGVAVDKCAGYLGMKTGGTISAIKLMEEFEEINDKRIRLLHFGDSGSAASPIKLIMAGHVLGKTENYCYIFDRKVPLRRLFEDYCKMENLAYNHMRFICNGRLVRKDLCADDCPEMEYGDTIDCFRQQYGG